MEVFLALLLILTCYVCILITRWAVNRRGSHKVLKCYGIPGPEPDFLSGNLKQLKSEPTPNDIITTWLKKYGNVVGYYWGDVPYVVISDLDMLKQIFIKDFHLFCNRPKFIPETKYFNKTLISIEAKRWKEIRTILTPTFSSRKIKLMKQIVDKKVDITVDVVSKKAEKGEMFDMYEVVQGLTLEVIADCALAMKAHCQTNPQDTLLTAVRDFFRFAHNRAIDYAIMFPFVASVMSFISNNMTSGQMMSFIVGNVRCAIAERRKNPETKNMDLLQMLLDHSALDSEDNGGLTDEEILANSYTFLLAGYETTSSALAFTFYLLIKHPDIQERLYKEIQEVEDPDYNTIEGFQYLSQVFCESLRLYPPVTGFLTRACEEDHQVGSVMIPKGANILAPIWYIHHNPEYWPDPWKFDPDRFSLENKASLNSAAYMPFGVGRRNCIGSRFAQLEAKLAIFRLIKKFKFEVCEKTEDSLSLICPTVAINPANGVWLKAVPRTIVF